MPASGAAGTATHPTTTVVIAAHNEAGVIGGTLDVLLRDAAVDELDVIVAANGCTDDTAGVAAARPGVRVVEVEQASKVAALDAAEQVARTFPRVYLDADIPVGVEVVRALRDALTRTGAVVAVPARRVALEGRPWPVRCYYAIHGRLPAVRDGLYGRGMIAVSEAGRARFGTFPAVQADDLFLDSLYGRDERVHVTAVATTVEAPLRTRDLLHRLVRVRRGNTVLRAGAPTGPASPTATVRGSSRTAWLAVVARRPWLAPAGVVYAGLTLLAERAARRDLGSVVWERDETTRGAAVPRGSVTRGSGS